jgi:hypothetical protein
MQDRYEPEFIARERRYGDFDSHSRRQRVMFLTVGFGMALFLFVLALSARQATASDTAQQVLQNGIASVTEVDLVLAEQLPVIRQLSTTSDQPSFAVPGYPVPVELSRDEAANLPVKDLRTLILGRSAAIVYTKGLGAFDRTGHQSLSLLSAEGILRLATGQLSASSHSRATTATVVLGVLLALLAALLMASQHGYQRLQVLGAGLLVGAVPGAALFALLRFAVGHVGGSDPFVADLRSVAESLSLVVVRNFAILDVLGGLFAVSPWVLRLVERRVPALAAAADDPVDFDDGFDYVESEELEDVTAGRPRG